MPYSNYFNNGRYQNRPLGYNIWPNEVIHEICKRRIPTIAGNYDFGIGRNSNDCGCAYKTDTEKANGAVSISFTNQVIAEEERQYLRTLPAHIKVEFQLNNDKRNLLLVHGSPRVLATRINLITGCCRATAMPSI